MEAVCAQYKRWRTYNRYAKRKPRGCCRKRVGNCNLFSNNLFCFVFDLKENSCGCDRTLEMPPQSQTPQNLSTSNEFYDIDDDFDTVFTNELFESLNAPFLFPNPKESKSDFSFLFLNPVFAVQCANADIMQPGLLSLQPSIEEIMSVGRRF